MKLARLVTSTAGLVAVAALSIGVVHANQITLDPNGTYSYDRGGEFTVTGLSGADAALLDTTSAMSSGTSGDFFRTFCLETDEYVSNSPGIYDFVLNTSATASWGGSNTNGGDQIRQETAYLYTQFWNGNLLHYNPNDTSPNNRTTDARDLQAAIWTLENENGVSFSVSSQAQNWIDSAKAAVANGGWSGWGNVVVLNMFAQGHAREDNYRKQDILAMVDPTSVPAPSVLTLFGFGLLLMGGGIVISRRRKPQGGAFRDGGLAT